MNFVLIEALLPMIIVSEKITIQSHANVAIASRYPDAVVLPNSDEFDCFILDEGSKQNAYDSESVSARLRGPLHVCWPWHNNDFSVMDMLKHGSQSGNSKRFMKSSTVFLVMIRMKMNKE
uniref:RNase H domain-containing protein n=1 Tax=Caenorhabditis tropicalis TaxID=1561998 RepID=A0A1I7UF31_9PELO